jgi:hypothetical protein
MNILLKKIMSEKKIKLKIELIPKTCHFKNARLKLKPYQWDYIRKYCYHKANYKCEICGLTGTEQGFKNNLDCHEIWGFNKKTLTQKLIGLIALCPLCHQTKHFKKASMMGRQHIIFKHLEKINNWNHKQVVQHLAEEYLKCEERSKHYWKLDFSILLKKPYNIIIKKNKKYKYKKQSKKNMN